MDERVKKLMREMFRVVAKAAIYNRDKSKIIVIYMNRNNDYGLPGGHIEADETIDDCMAREIYEECGIRVSNLQRKTFFKHENGKIVLAYVGSVDDETLRSNQDNLEGEPIWLNMAEFSKITIDPGYRELVLTGFSQ